MKVLLVLLDGMRPDAIGDIPQVQAMIREGASTLEAQTVFPSVTLPCHMSLFHSVDPARHGTTTNIYMPQVRPVDGLCEMLKAAKKRSAFFYNWHELRDLARPGNLAYEHYLEGHVLGWEQTTTLLCDSAIDHIRKYAPDFTFFYTGLPDETGHAKGWMSPEYLEALRYSWKEVGRLTDSLPEDYTVIVIADHGGHDRTHGTTMPEDMTIPVFLKGKDFPAGSKLQNVSIKDIAPTVAALLGADPAVEWEGKPLYEG